MPPSACRLVACGMNCPLLALSITGRPASIFSASHCWLLLNCASPRNASVTRLAVSTPVTSRKRSPGCSNHSRLVAPSLTTGVAASGKAANSGASAARAWKPATPSRTRSSLAAMVTLEKTAYFSARSAARRAGCGAQSTRSRPRDGIRAGCSTSCLWHHSGRQADAGHR